MQGKRKGGVDLHRAPGRGPQEERLQMRTHPNRYCAAVSFVSAVGQQDVRDLPFLV